MLAAVQAPSATSLAVSDHSSAVTTLRRPEPPCRVARSKRGKKGSVPVPPETGLRVSGSTAHRSRS